MLGQARIGQDAQVPGRKPERCQSQPGERQMQRPEQRYFPDAGVIPARQAQQIAQAEQQAESRQPGIGPQAQATGEARRQQHAAH
ncbi:hypothetical protein D9M73_286790 [compost metagenome]